MYSIDIGCHRCTSNKIQGLKPTHPDAELHIFSAVNFHTFIQQANLLKVFPVNHKAADQSRTPKTEKGDEVRENKDIKYVLEQNRTKCIESREFKCKIILKTPTLKHNLNPQSAQHWARRSVLQVCYTFRPQSFMKSLCSMHYTHK